MNTSATAIKNPIDIPMPSFALGTGSCPAGDGQERIVLRIHRLGWRDRLKPRDRPPTVRQNKSLTSRNPPQNSRRTLTKSKHGHCLHLELNFNFNFNLAQKMCHASHAWTEKSE
jgi:hypothetical protein